MSPIPIASAKFMKGLLWAFALSLGFLGVSGAQTRCEKLTFTGPPASPPTSWVLNGKLSGASVELLESLLKKTEIKTIEQKIFPNWGEALDSVYKGEVDIIMYAGWSSERARFLNYIEPAYASEFVQVVVRKGEAFPLLSVNDLASPRKGVTMRGSTYGDGLFGQFVNKEMKPRLVATPREALELLVNGSGDVDFFFAYENGIRTEVFENNFASKVDYLTTFPHHANNYYALSKRSKCYDAVHEIVSTGVIEANENKTYHRLVKTYRTIFEESFEK
jgi:ABC-type amino acid transport substrate-binding protein